MATEYRKIQVNRGTADDWAAATVPLLVGEWGFDVTNGLVKIGDGFSLWAELPVFMRAGSDGQLPDVVRDALAANLADPATPEGAALAEAIAAGGGGAAPLDYDPASGLYSVPDVTDPPIAPVDPATKLFPSTILDALDVRNAGKYPALNKAGAAALASQTGAAMEPWLSALANRSNAPARILAVGDSILEGAFATARAKRWVDRLMTALRARFPQAAVGGIGHLPPYYVGGIPAVMGNPFTTVSTSVPTADSTFGLGRRSAHMFASNNQSYTYTITGTSFWLWFTQGPSTGSFGVSIDGGPVTSFATNGALADGKTWVSPTLAAGTHTVQITVVSGDVYFGGLTVFNGDETGGIQMFESGHWGWKTTDWVSNGAYWGDVATTIQPQLIMIALMTNDYQAGVDPATSKANIQTMITALRAKCTVPPTVVLLTYPARGDVTTAAYPWSAYVAAAASIAASDAGVAHLDLSARYASPATSNVLGNWNGDKVHPTDKGHGLIAETVLSFVSPR